MHMQRAGFPQNQQTRICTTQRAIVYGHVHGPLHTIACGYFRRKLSRAMYAMGHHLQLNSTQLPAEISTCNCMQWPAMYMANHIIYALPWSIGWCISTRHHRHCTCRSIPQFHSGHVLPAAGMSQVPATARPADKGGPCGGACRATSTLALEAAPRANSWLALVAVSRVTAAAVPPPPLLRCLRCGSKQAPVSCTKVPLRSCPSAMLLRRTNATPAPPQPKPRSRRNGRRSRTFPSHRGTTSW